MSIKENIKRIRKEIPGVRIVGVTKKKSTEYIVEAIDAGIVDIGENYVQEAEEKFSEVDRKFVKHFIGHIQSNKVKKIVELFDFIQSVDRLKIVRLIDEEAKKIKKKVSVLVEVNISGEESKSGIDPMELDDFLKYCGKYDNVLVKGLMTIGPSGNDDDLNKKKFLEMKNLYDNVKDRYGLSCLSMGMTGDYKVAVSCGSNMVRIGTGIFGKRD